MCNVEGQGGTAVEISKRETAQYMADMLLEMRNMAKAAGFVTLISLFVRRLPLQTMWNHPRAKLRELMNFRVRQMGSDFTNYG